MLIKYKQNNYIILNQLKSKLLFKNLYNFKYFDSINISLNLRKLKSFNDIIILEGLFLLEFLTSLKTSINYYKKMYQEVNIQLLSKLRKDYIFYFIYILKVLYLPILIRRNENLKCNLDKTYNYNLTLININILPFIPDIYFK